MQLLQTKTSLIDDESPQQLPRAGWPRNEIRLFPQDVLLHDAQETEWRLARVKIGAQLVHAKQFILTISKSIQAVKY